MVIYMILENLVKYPLDNATGYDVDETLIMIRVVEMNGAEIIRDLDSNKLDLRKNTRRQVLEYIYREYSSTQVDLNKVKLEYFDDALSQLLLLSL